MMDAKDYSVSMLKVCICFAFEQSESTPVPLDKFTDSLIYFVINAQLCF